MGIVMFDRPPRARVLVDSLPDTLLRHADFRWHGDIRSVHVRVDNKTDRPVTVYVHRLRVRDESAWSTLDLGGSESYRFILSSEADDELGVEIAIPSGVESTLHEVFDRAHFPTLAVRGRGASSDVTPLPIFQPGR
jgi:pyruvate formate lyase activating enzyme